MSALLDAAVKYGADMHWLVFPQAWPRDGKCSCGKPHCDHPAKHPHYGLAPNGHKDATNYRDAIGRFWQRDPDANIGLACGKLSLVVALDVDPRHGGDESLARLEREHGPLPLTPCSRTGGGGRHLFFRCPKGAVTGGDLAPGVELKANTAVTLPPSRHISGGAYEWMEGRSPFEIPLAELPAWVLERKTERRAATSTPGAPILDGTRNSTLTSLAGGMRAKGWSGDAIRAALHEENTLRCDPPLPDSEVDAIAKSIGSKTPRTETVSKGALTVTACSGITEKKIDWLWKGYVPRGVLTFLEGPPKAGKSTVYVDLAARVSTGTPMPDGQPPVSGAVLILGDEDSAAAVTVPRLRIAGANLDAVHIIKAKDEDDRPRQFLVGPADTANLEALIEATGAVLIVIDPLSVYLGSTDTHSEKEVRQALWYLVDLAERTNVAILCVRHWNKALTGSALAQGGGSVGFSAAARAILSVARDPEDKNVRVLAPGYVQYVQEYPSLAFVLKSPPGEELAFVEWRGPSRHDADALASIRINTEDGDATREAKEFLERILLPEGARVLANDVLAAAKEEGIAQVTLNRAKRQLGVKSFKQGLTGPHQWGFPEDGEVQS